MSATVPAIIAPIVEQVTVIVPSTTPTSASVRSKVLTIIAGAQKANEYPIIDINT